MPGRTVTTVTSTTDGYTGGRMSRSRDVYEDELPRDIRVRRQDQLLVDDITDKLYKIEMDRVKPGHDVQLMTSTFRSKLPARRLRTSFTPEPVQRTVQVSRDLRRYSTAGNLDIYRPVLQQNQYSYERPASSVVEYNRSVTSPLPIEWKRWQYEAPDALAEIDIRRQAEMSVRGRQNGPIVRTISYQPLVSRSREVFSPERYKEVLPHRPSVGVTVGSAKKVSDGKYELDQFEKLMKRNFGDGGLNRHKTLLYSNSHASQPLPPPYVYSSPYASAAYYSRSPYHGYTPYPLYYSQPYSYFSPAYTPYSYSYVGQNPSQYYSGIYSPPSKVTPPWLQRTYYDTDFYGRHYSLPRYPTSYSHTYYY